MNERIDQFLATADSPETRDLNELKELYKLITDKEPKCESDQCISKMLNEVRKYRFKSEVKTPERKYTLKPGNHTFAPGACADHNNDNTSDSEIEFYIKHYPHVKDLLM